MSDVFIHQNGNSTERNCAESVMLELGLDPSDFRLRDRLISAMSPWIDEEFHGIGRRVKDLEYACKLARRYFRTKRRAETEKQRLCENLLHAMGLKLAD